MNRLKELRKKQGLTRKELSEKTGINIRTLESYEQNLRDLRVAKAEYINKICNVLHCKFIDLFEIECIRGDKNVK